MVFEQIFDHLVFLAVVLVASGVSPELGHASWGMVETAASLLLWGWGLQEGMDTLPTQELQRLPPSPHLRPAEETYKQRSSKGKEVQLSALSPPPFHSQHAAPLCFTHIGNISQGHPSIVHMLNTSYSVPPS